MYLRLQATMLVELLCLLVFALRLVHYAKVIPRDKFWKDPKNICIIVILMVRVPIIAAVWWEGLKCYACLWFGLVGLLQRGDHQITVPG